MALNCPGNVLKSILHWKENKILQAPKMFQWKWSFWGKKLNQHFILHQPIGYLNNEPNVINVIKVLLCNWLLRILNIKNNLSV